MVHDGSQGAPERLPLQRAARGEDVPSEEYEVTFRDRHLGDDPDAGDAVARPIGRITARICAAIDITERKQRGSGAAPVRGGVPGAGREPAEPVLDGQLGRLDLLVQPGMVRLTGTTPAELTGWGWQSVHHPEALPSVMARWTGSLAAGTPSR